MFPNLLKLKTSLKRPALFHDAQPPLPQFLEHNLQDDARTVKYFHNDPDAFLKIFYYQFFCLCFETEHTDYDTKLNKFVQLMQQQTNLLPVPKKYTEHLPDQLAVKNMIFEFLEYLGECTESVYNCLSRFPVVDEVMRGFLSAYLQKSSINQKTNKAIFQQLCELLEIDVVQFDNCIQFVDTQIYLYSESPSEVYMIYIDEAKAQRNTKLSKTNQAILKSSQSINTDQQSGNFSAEVITFDEPQILFETGSHFGDSTKFANSMQTKQTFGNTQQSSANTKEKRPHFDQVVVVDQILRSISTNVAPTRGLNQQKETSEFNITKEFTNTFILEMVSEPHKSSISRMKAKARAERKTRQMFFK